MLNCIYKGKRINALTVVEEGNYEYRKEVKLAGSKKELICEDCNTPVFLRVCKFRESHFAHWRGFGEQCTYNYYSGKETEQHKTCKRILYNYMKKLYPNARIELEYKAVQNRRSDLYIEFEEGSRLVVDIQRGSISASKWDEKHNDYKKAGITDIWVILGQPSSNTERTMHFFQQIMLNESMNGIAIFLNVENEEVTLVKKIEYRDESTNEEYNELFQRKYKLSEISILPDGRINSAFHNEYNLAGAQFKTRFDEEGFVKQKVQSSNNTRSENALAPQSEQLSWSFVENKAAAKKEAASEPYAPSNLQLRSRSNLYSFNNTKVANIMKAYIRRAGWGEKECIYKLVEMLHQKRDNYSIFMEIYSEMQDGSNESGINTCKQVLIKAGMEY